MNKHVVVYSHGFGVRKDDRGLFTDIAIAMPEVEHIMFNYNLIDEANNTLTASPLQNQVKILKEQLAKIDPGKTIDIVAHSQGCIVAALAKPKNVRKIICIAAPYNAGAERLIKYFSDYNGRLIDPEVQSKIKRRDGSMTIIPAAYWQSLRGLNVMDFYNALAEQSKVTIIIANQDEVLGATDFSAADERIKQINIDGNHDFNGDERQNLVKIVKKELSGDKIETVTHKPIQPEVTINRAQPQDAEAISELLRQTWLATYPNKEAGITIEDIRLRTEGVNGERINQNIENWRKNIEVDDRTSIVYVARMQSKVVGLAAPSIYKGKRHVGALYVLPEYQGLGIGGELMHKILDWHGNDSDIYLRVASYNKKAINFYKSFGFRQTKNKVTDEGNVYGETLIPEIEMMRKASSDK